MPYFFVWASAGIISLALSLLGGLSRHSDNIDCEPEEQKSWQQIKYRPSPDITVLVHAIRNEGRANRKEEQREDSRKQFLEIVTILLLALTLIAIFMQVHEMVKVYGPIQKSAEAAEKQAKAAAGQVDLMQGQLNEMKSQRLFNIAQTRAVLRRTNPVMHPAGIDLGKPTQKLLGWNVNPIWMNVGTTDAREVRGWWDIVVTPTPPLIDNKITAKCPTLKTPPILPEPSVVQKAGGITELAKFLSINDVMQAANQQPTVLIYILGHIEYTDIYYPETHLHHFDWCVMALPNDIEKNAFSFLSVYEKSDR